MVRRCLLSEVFRHEIFIFGYNFFSFSTVLKSTGRYFCYSSITPNKFCDQKFEFMNYLT